MFIFISICRKRAIMKQFLSIILLLLPIFVYSDDFIGWKELETEHYRFIFEEKDKDTAFELAGYGEEIYNIVSDFFNYYPKRINIYINGRIDTPNGFFYPIPGSINLYPAYPLNSENATKSESWLYELLLHEMVHYISLENPRGFFGGLSYIFGKDLAAANGAFLPAWLIEGIAVYLETKYTNGGRGRNLYFRAFNDAAALEEKYPNIYQLAYSSDFPPYNRIYSGGYLLTEHLLKTYGEDIFQRVYLRYTKFPFFGPFHAFRKETGYSIKEIYESLKEKEISKFNSRRSLREEYPSAKLSPASYSNWTHPVDTDKGIMIYRRAQDEKSSILCIDKETGNQETVVEVELIDSSSFNSDSTGNILVFSKADYSLYHMYGYSIISNLYIHENGKTRLLNENQSLFQPAISSDGENIIAVQRRGAYSRLVSVDKLNGQITILFEKEETNIMNPVFSHSSDKIAFVLNDHGYQDIYLIDASNPGSIQPLMTIDMHSEYYPRFIDDDTISFISDRDDDLSLFSFNLQNRQLKLRFKDPVGVADAYIQNNKVYYNSYRTNGYELRQGEIGLSKDYSLFDSNTSLPSITEKTAYETKKYIDWTLPYLWLPKPELKITATEGVQTGIGAVVFAGSYGQSGEWIFNFNYTPGLGQMNGSFDFSQKLGTTSLGYNFLQSYDEIYNGSNYIWRQSTDQGLQWIIPLFEKSRLNWRNVIKTYLSINHKLQITNTGTFSFTDSFSMNPENFLYSGAGFIYNGFNINYPAKSLFGDTSIQNRIDFSILLPLLSSEITTFVIKDSLILALPFGPEGFLLQTRIQGAYHSGQLSSSALSARGWTPTYVNSDISMLYSMDYLMPLALLDAGMPFGFNIQNIALAVHFEGISNFSFSGSTYNELFCGLEFIGTYGYNYGTTPIGAGINFRVYRQGSSFIPSEDIKFYFFLSLNSLY